MPPARWSWAGSRTWPARRRVVTRSAGTSPRCHRRPSAASARPSGAGGARAPASSSPPTSRPASRSCWPSRTSWPPRSPASTRPHRQAASRSSRAASTAASPVVRTGWCWSPIESSSAPSASAGRGRCAAWSRATSWSACSPATRSSTWTTAWPATPASCVDPPAAQGTRSATSSSCISPAPIGSGCPWSRSTG